MDSFHATGYGLVSQFTVKAMAKKMAKSNVGKSMRPDQLAAPNVLPPRAVEGRRVVLSCCDQAPAAAPGPPDQLLALSASISAGRTLCTSPTMPRSATEKIGASRSLLMAMMFFDP